MSRHLEVMCMYSRHETRQSSFASSEVTKNCLGTTGLHEIYIGANFDCSIIVWKILNPLVKFLQQVSLHLQIG